MVEPDERLGELRERFARFAREARAGDSPLYERLSAAAAQDHVTIELLSSTPDERQRRPNLLFAAVHHLLLEDATVPLARYYPSVGGHRAPDDGAEEAFRDFVRDRRDEVMRWVSRRSTQTNEVGRCGALWPALRQVARRLGGPIALVEPGCSAGLLLHLDRYRYDLGGPYPGTASSPVVIAPELLGAGAPPEGGAPDIVRRIGIDLSPLDPTDPGDARWLQACVWPEHTERLAQLRTALEVAGGHDDVETVAGELLETLPGVLGELPDGCVPVVFHSAALAYLDADGRNAVRDALADVGQRRDLAWIALEGHFVAPFADLAERAALPAAETAFLLGLSVWRAGTRQDALLGRSHPHGRWLQWLAPPAGG